MPGQKVKLNSDVLDRVLQLLSLPPARRWWLVCLGLIPYFSLTFLLLVSGVSVFVTLILVVAYMTFVGGLLGLPRAWYVTAIVGVGYTAIVALAIGLYDRHQILPFFSHRGLLSDELLPFIVTMLTVLLPLLVGSISGVFGTLILRTQQEIQARRVTEAQYRLLIEETSDVAFITDLKGRFTYLSPSTYNLTGYRREELLGKRFVMLIDPEWQETIFAFYKEQFASKLQETTFLLPIRRADNELRWVEQTVVAKMNGDEITGFHALARDVTDRKRAEDELQAARDKAVMASRFKSQLLANISHDLRTPLSTMMLISEMLQQGFYGETNEDQHNRLQIIRDSGAMLMLLIKNLLDEAQLEAGKLELNVGPFSAKHWLGITSVLKPLVEQRGLIWEEEIDDDLPAVLYGDPERLKQVLSNLTTNAAKFTRKGAVKLRVYQIDHAHWGFDVSDTGRGIAPHMIDKVFDPFWQEDGSTTREKQSGVGLGLSIVKQLTERMGGSVSVTSVEGEGACFTVKMPLPHVERASKKTIYVSESVRA